jgi:hypothetical protein
LLTVYAYGDWTVNLLKCENFDQLLTNFKNGLLLAKYISKRLGKGYTQFSLTKLKLPLYPVAQQITFFKN